MARENPTWSAPWIQCELALLGHTVAESRVGKCQKRQRKPPSQTWRTFVGNHVPDTGAIDFLIVATVIFRVPYRFIVVRNDRRPVVHFNVTPRPTARWTARNPYGLVAPSRTAIRLAAATPEFRPPSMYPTNLKHACSPAKCSRPSPVCSSGPTVVTWPGARWKRRNREWRRCALRSTPKLRTSARRASRSGRRVGQRPAVFAPVRDSGNKYVPGFAPRRTIRRTTSSYVGGVTRYAKYSPRTA